MLSSKHALPDLLYRACNQGACRPTLTAFIAETPMRKPILIFSLLGAILLAPLSVRAPLAQTVAPETTSQHARVIVKYKSDSTLLRKSIQSTGTQSAEALRSAQVQSLGSRLGLALSAGAGITDRSHVVFASGLTSEQLAQRIAAESDVEYAVPDLRRRRLAVPNDPLYATRAYNNPSAPTSGGPVVGQWYLKPSGPATTSPTATTANTAPASINAQGAWDVTTGSASIVVAVIDTGIRFDHADFRTVANGGNLLPGYDMISADTDGTFTTANDGDGRDADASDPGDFVVQADVNRGGCGRSDVGDLSSWHGTQTAGMIGAVTDNGIGIASVGRNVRVLPVRALGKCGGFDSDIIAGMLWAAGLPVAGVPTNTNKARVINLSLGGSGTCGQNYIDAITQINAAGTVIVVSAGNTNGLAVSVPANCPGVIGVGGLRHIGTKVGFSDLGPQIALSAPGGNCINTTSTNPCLYPILTTFNSGTTTPVSNAAGGSTYTDSFHASLGTSFSAPLVAGTAALMLSAQPLLTPAEVRSKLLATARPFPTSTIDDTGATIPVCSPPSTVEQVQCVCTTALCGAGMLDAHGAVLAAAGVQARIGVSTTAPVVGQPVTLDASSTLIPAGRTIAAYQWALTNGGGIVSSLTGATTGPTVSATPVANGSFVVTLTVTDNTGAVSAQSLTVNVSDSGDAPAPAPGDDGGGGGGALGAGWLLLLGVVILALWRLRHATLRR